MPLDNPDSLKALDQLPERAKELLALDLPPEKKVILSGSVAAITKLCAALFSDNLSEKMTAINNALKELQNLSSLVHSFKCDGPRPLLSDNEVTQAAQNWSEVAATFIPLLARAENAGQAFGLLRRKLGISGAEIAAECGVTKGGVSDWERGRAPLPEAALGALFQVSQSRLLETKPLTGNELRKLRERQVGRDGHKMRQADLAMAIGVHVNSVHDWERRGSQPLPISAMRRLASWLAEQRAVT